MSSKPPVEPAWLTIKECSRYAGPGKTSIYQAISSGKLEARKAFGRTLVSRASLDAYLAAAPRVLCAQMPNGLESTASDSSQTGAGADHG